MEHLQSWSIDMSLPFRPASWNAKMKAEFPDQEQVKKSATHLFQQAGDKSTSPAMNRISCIAHIGNFPPQRCGIATFTKDTVESIFDNFNGIENNIYPLVDAGMQHSADSILRHDTASYRKAARSINMSGADLAWLQHEFGIFGGREGEYLLDFMDVLAVPLVVTLHTILDSPNPQQFGILCAILKRAQKVIVMAEKGRDILINRYGANPQKIEIIAHGIPDKPYTEPDAVKPFLNLQGKKVLLTFGLMSRDKGIEDMVKAMPNIVKNCPQAHYIILGATHPGVLASEGEAYREQLVASARDLGVSQHISWVNRYVNMDELTMYLQAADIYVTPYHNPAQITSGTLAYAVGLGKPVVSTRYVHATELVSSGIGRLVDFKDPDALADTISILLSSSEERQRMARLAYQKGRSMTWQRYAANAMRIFNQLSEMNLKPQTASYT